VIKGNFHRVIGTKAVGSSGDYSDFVVEALNGTVGDFSFGPKPIQDQRLMGAKHPGHLFHGFQRKPPAQITDIAEETPPDSETRSRPSVLGLAKMMTPFGLHAPPPP
jgi:hypothetical protein